MVLLSSHIFHRHTSLSNGKANDGTQSSCASRNGSASSLTYSDKSTLEVSQYSSPGPDACLPLAAAHPWNKT